MVPSERPPSHFPGTPDFAPAQPRRPPSPRPGPGGPTVKRMERPDPIVLARLPETEAERKELHAACKRQARAAGKSGRQLDLETERVYQASLAAVQSPIRIVRRPVLIESPHEHRPPQELRTAAGLIVPGR